MNAQHCLHCGNEVKGRRDKKYCDDQCRNLHYNQRHGNEVLYMRNIHNLLRKNRRMLCEMIPKNQSTCEIDLDDLLLLGFSLKYHTHVQLQVDQPPIYFCYEYGYQLISSHSIRIFKQEYQQVA
jgi:predicted nucleic acid-binding Zn ribbon protein